jgi:Cytochrome c554 and c-prime
MMPSLSRIFWVMALFCGCLPQLLVAQNLRCDPTKVLTTETCVRCHTNEVAQWKKTPHFSTFETLARNPRANEISSKLGLASVKRNDLCISCHFTVQNVDGKSKPIAGVSCESCHGASRDWLNVHNDFGGPLSTRDSESFQHRQQRLTSSIELGMRNTSNVYRIAQSCYGCHTVPNEQLVNVGGHHVASSDFELVAWSQGIVRHNFLHDSNNNPPATKEKLRVLFVAGMIADLEFSTRATAAATTTGTYGVAVAERAAKVSLRLFELQKQLNDPNLQLALAAFARAELKTNNSAQLNQIADEIARAGLAFVAEHDGLELSAVDRLLPDPSQYRN